jgi:glycosyltransferase involved in cell wall biosynthesis
MHGFISDVKEISKIIKSFQVALAPYKMIEGSIRLYGDATKIRLYLAAGLPVITTKVPPLGLEAQKKGAAIIVGDNKEELADAIISIFETGL